MRERLARIAARTQKIVEGHLNESMEDIHQNLDKMEQELEDVRRAAENEDIGIDQLLDEVLPSLDVLDGCLKNIKEAK